MIYVAKSNTSLTIAAAATFINQIDSWIMELRGQNLRQNLFLLDAQIQKIIRTHDITSSSQPNVQRQRGTLERFEREPCTENLLQVHASLKEPCILGSKIQRFTILHWVNIPWIIFNFEISLCLICTFNYLNTIWRKFPIIRAEIQQILQKIRNILWKFCESFVKIRKKRDIFDYVITSPNLPSPSLSNVIIWKPPSPRWLWNKWTTPSPLISNQYLQRLTTW
jgi:hypothetical protein